MIDGLETFEKYYELLMSAQHSIAILGWEISFSFGLILTSRVKVSRIGL
jgi:hypothetical protein